MIRINELDGGEIKDVPVAFPAVQLVSESTFEPPSHRGPYDGDDYEPLAEGRECDELTAFAVRLPVRDWANCTEPGFDIRPTALGSREALRHSHVSFYLTGGSQDLLDFVHEQQMTVTMEQIYLLDADQEARAVLPPVMRQHRNILDRQGRVRRNEFSDMLRLARNTAAKLIKVFAGTTPQERLAEDLFRGGAITSAALYPRLTEIPMLVTGSYRQWLDFVTAALVLPPEREAQEFGRLILKKLASTSPRVFGQLWDCTQDHHDYAEGGAGPCSECGAPPGPHNEPEGW